VRERDRVEKSKKYSSALLVFAKRDKEIFANFFLSK